MIEVTSTHVATLVVPRSGDPSEVVTITTAPDQRSMTFTVLSTVSDADARRKLREFLQATAAAAQASA